jgi:hypothetical protein
MPELSTPPRRWSACAAISVSMAGLNGADVLAIRTPPAVTNSVPPPSSAAQCWLDTGWLDTGWLDTGWLDMAWRCPGSTLAPCARARQAADARKRSPLPGDR